MTSLATHLHDTISQCFPFSYILMIFVPSATGHTFRRCTHRSAPGRLQTVRRAHSFFARRRNTNMNTALQHPSLHRRPWFRLLLSGLTMFVLALAAVACSSQATTSSPSSSSATHSTTRSFTVSSNPVLQLSTMLARYICRPTEQETASACKPCCQEMTPQACTSAMRNGTIP